MPAYGAPFRRRVRRRPRTKTWLDKTCAAVNTTWTSIKSAWTYTRTRPVLWAKKLYTTAYSYCSRYYWHAVMTTSGLRWTILTGRLIHHAVKSYFEITGGFWAMLVHLAIWASMIAAAWTAFAFSTEWWTGKDFPWAEIWGAAILINLYYTYEYVWFVYCPWNSKESDQRAFRLKIVLPFYVAAVSWMVYCEYEQDAAWNRWQKQQRDIFFRRYGARWKAQYTKQTGVVISPIMAGLTPEQEALQYAILKLLLYSFVALGMWKAKQTERMPAVVASGDGEFRVKIELVLVITNAATVSPPPEPNNSKNKNKKKGKK